jgi:hypothetical protein
MPEPATTTAAVTLAAGSIAVPALTIAGIPLGLRPEILIAGFAGSLVAIILLNSVPATGDTLIALLRTTLRRMMVALASSLTAGYLAPMVHQLAQLPDYMLLGTAFATGGGAQRVLLSALHRIVPPAPGEGAA